MWVMWEPLEETYLNVILKWNDKILPRMCVCEIHVPDVGHKSGGLNCELRLKIEAGPLSTWTTSVDHWSICFNSSSLLHP